MQVKTLTTLSVLNDLRHAAYEALGRKHRLPALLLLYSFIDVCASVACEAPDAGNGERFVNYLKRYYLPNWGDVAPEDFWAARSSLLHTFSPIGRNTKSGVARPIFYFSWPEKRDDVRAILDAKGHSHYLLLDVRDVDAVSLWCFNALWRRVENEPEFENTVIGNSEHLLKDLFQHGLEAELTNIEALVAARNAAREL